MKKLYFLLAFLVAGVSTKAAPVAEVGFDRRSYSEAFIFVERGVEFAVFLDGQFDFFFDPRGNFRGIPSHINYSFNSGYNYGPFVQYDDFGAVIQIEHVPVYYDYYGRIIQAGRVQIRYNAFGMVNRIGNMFVHYDPYHRYTHTSGFINNRNVRYTYRPWHDYYMRPYSHFSIVYNEPYRLYYHPNRMKYNAYKRYYQKNYYNNDSFRKSYYRPGERVTSYQRGRRVEEPREVRRQSNFPRNQVSSSQRLEQRDIRRTPSATQRSEMSTRTSRRTSVPSVQQRTEQQRTVQREVEQQRIEQRRTVRENRSARSAAQNNVQQESRRSPVTTAPPRAARVESRRTEPSATVNSEENSSTPVRSSRSSSGNN
ncbi:hypothetical protein [Salinimicrobium sp. HB62]|uniref:hypothetical protein n=1 Tax=Salinimicrobium sp. HB62 TaxID=3077781 RepID=UPI002D79F07A|nr:hypothetical protein [Salinimicrobium sp. HB62]